MHIFHQYVWPLKTEAMTLVWSLCSKSTCHCAVHAMESVQLKFMCSALCSKTHKRWGLTSMGQTTVWHSFNIDCLPCVCECVCVSVCVSSLFRVWIAAAGIWLGPLQKEREKEREKERRGEEKDPVPCFLWKYLRRREEAALDWWEYIRALSWCVAETVHRGEQQ